MSDYDKLVAALEIPLDPEIFKGTPIIEDHKQIMDMVFANSEEEPVWPNQEPVKPQEGEVFYKCCDHCYPPPNQNGCATLNAHTVPCNEGEVPCREGKEVVSNG